MCCWLWATGDAAAVLGRIWQCTCIVCVYFCLCLLPAVLVRHLLGIGCPTPGVCVEPGGCCMELCGTAWRCLELSRVIWSCLAVSSCFPVSSMLLRWTSSSWFGPLEREVRHWAGPEWKPVRLINQQEVCVLLFVLGTFRALQSSSAKNTGTVFSNPNLSKSIFSNVSRRQDIPVIHRLPSELCDLCAVLIF